MKHGKQNTLNVDEGGGSKSCTTRRRAVATAKKRPELAVAIVQALLAVGATDQEVAAIAAAVPAQAVNIAQICPFWSATIAVKAPSAAKEIVARLIEEGNTLQVLAVIGRLAAELAA